MGYFTEGYKKGEAIQKGECTPEEYEKALKKLLKEGKYSDAIEWYTGFYKAMLDVDLKRLEQGFISLKKEAEKGKK